MDKFLTALTKLFNVKSIVTVALTVVFSALAMKEIISAEQFVSIFTVVIAFYFGTQHEKKNPEAENSKSDNF